MKRAEQQINVVLTHQMTYRTAMASLTEARLNIELAFMFILLSFQTSGFGMKFEMLGTGLANILVLW